MPSMFGRRRTDGGAVMVAVNCVAAGPDDVLVVAHPAGDRQRTDGRSSGSAKIEEFMGCYNCVLVPPKEIQQLRDHFGGLWTESAQYRIFQVKQRHVFALVYGGELKIALAHVNGYLGGQISFYGDDIDSFVGSLVDGNGRKQARGHSCSCCVVRLEKFCKPTDS